MNEKNLTCHPKPEDVFNVIEELKKIDVFLEEIQQSMHADKNLEPLYIQACESVRVLSLIARGPGGEPLCPNGIEK